MDIINILKAGMLREKAKKHGMTEEIESELKVLDFLFTCSEDDKIVLYNHFLANGIIENIFATSLNNLETKGMLSSKQADEVYEKFFNRSEDNVA